MTIDYSIKMNMNYLIKDFPSYSGNSQMTPEFIIIHDTANSANAENEAKRLQSANQYNNGIAHYYVDDIGGYQLIYDNIKAWHAGDGSEGKGNGKSIGIEVCKSLSSGNFTSDLQKETYEKALDNAYKLASDLCKAYGINPGYILQHNECSSTACPYTQKMLFGSYKSAKSNAIKKVNEYFGNENDSKSASDFQYRIIQDRVYKSFTNHLGFVDYDLGYLERNDLVRANFKPNGTNDGFDWYEVKKVKNFNDGSEYYVNPYYITKQGMNLQTEKPDGTYNFTDY